MKILLINNDSMVKKLFEAVAKKLGLDLMVQDNLNLPGTEDDFFLFIDDSIGGDYSQILSSEKNLMKTYLHKRNNKQAEGFEFYIKKPFLPTEVLDILKTRLADFGITEATTSNLTKDDIEEIPEYSFALDDFNLDEADDLGFKDIEEEDRGPRKPVPHISDNFNLDDLEEIQSVLDDMEKEKAKDKKEPEIAPIIDEDIQDIELPSAETEDEQEEEPDIEEILQSVKSDVEKSKQELEEESKNNVSMQAEEESSMESEKIQDQYTQAIEDTEDSDIKPFSAEDLLDDLHIDAKEETKERQEEQIIAQQDPVSEQNIMDDLMGQNDLTQDKNHNDDFDDFDLDAVSHDSEDPQEISDFSNVLDKKQIDEVKKILEETEDEENQNKEIAMAQASEAKEIEEIEEVDMMDILGDTTKGEDMKKTKTENTTQEDLDMSFDKIDDFAMMSDEFDKSALTEDLDVEEPLKGKSENDIQNFINNSSIDGLKSILDGMQLTINISFPNKKN